MSTPASDAFVVAHFLDRIANWLGEHVGEADGVPGSDAQLTELSDALGCELPPELIALLRFERALGVLAYSRIPPQQWAMALARSAVDGANGKSFAEQRWLPLFEDGGGNLWIVDLSLSRSVMRWWERAGRVVADHGPSLPAFFARLACYLESGKISYDAASSSFDDGPPYFFNLNVAPPVTSETVIVFRAAELAHTDLGIDAAARLPAGAGPYDCLYYVTALSNSKRMFAAIPEQDMDHIDEGMQLVQDVMDALVQRCNLSAFGATAGIGFHASPADAVERWLRSQDDLVVMPLATLLVALDAVASATADATGTAMDTERDYDIGKRHFDQLVRGDAMIGIISDVPAFTASMMVAFWRAAEAGDARAFATLGECYFAVLVPCGAFDGVSPESNDKASFSKAALQIEDEAFPPLTYALRCWYEAAVRGDRAALLRFAHVSRTGPDTAKRLALELFSKLEEPSPQEVHLRGLVHASLGDVSEHTAAAERGDLEAAFDLYVIYAQGQGVNADAARSRQWLEWAAAGNHPRALYNVAAEYATGNGRDKDPVKAAQLYATAAELGNPRAAASLAYMILSGECAGSTDDARHWLNVADDGGFDTATMLGDAGLDDPRVQP